MRRRLFVVYVNLGSVPDQSQVSIYLVIDDSGSMRGEPIRDLRAAVHEFVSSVPEDCAVGLVGFGREVRVFSAPAEEKGCLAEVINRFEGEGGNTRLYDGVALACKSFIGNREKRYLIVMTDGGDCTSTDHSLESAIKIAREEIVTIYAVGFGGVHEAPLRRMAGETGGGYHRAASTENLNQELARIWEEIAADLNKCRLRKEVCRIVDDSYGSNPPWLLHLSLDEGEASGAAAASSLLFDPPPQLPEGTSDKEKEVKGLAITAYRQLWTTSLRERVREWVRTAAKVQAASNAASAFPLGFDLMVAGWLDDTAFRALSLPIVELFDELADEDLLRGDMMPNLLALIPNELSEAAADLKAECYAWFSSAARRKAATNKPLGVIVCGPSNTTREENLYSYSAAGKERIIRHTANTIRCLALAESHFRSICAPSAGAKTMPLCSVGSGSIAANFRAWARWSATDALRALVDYLTSPAQREMRAQEAVKRVTTGAQLELARLCNSLLQPELGVTDAGLLHSLEIAVARFWPEKGPEEAYLNFLPVILDEQAALLVENKASLIRRVLDIRITARRNAAESAVREATDGFVGQIEEGAIENARLFLEQLLQYVQQQAARIDIDHPYSQALEGLVLFSDRESRLGKRGKLTIAAARRLLRERLGCRALLEAFRVRCAVLALVAGVLFGQLASWLSPAGPIAAIVGGGGAGVLVMALGAYYWGYSRARIRTAVEEYLSAVVRQAQAGVEHQIIVTLCQFYNDLGALIGCDDAIPQLLMDSGYDETQLSERQLVRSFRRLLESMCEMRRSRGGQLFGETNPAVWEVRPAGCPGEGSRFFEIPLPEDSAPWDGEFHRHAWIGARTGNWRLVGRLRFFESVREWCRFHQEKVEFPSRLWGELKRATEQWARQHNKLSDLLKQERFREAFADLRHLAAPPLTLSRAAASVSTQSHGIGDPADWKLLGRPETPSSTCEPSETHLLKTATFHPDESAHWTAFQTAWRGLTKQQRADLSATFGLTPESGTTVVEGAGNAVGEASSQPDAEAVPKENQTVTT